MRLIMLLIIAVVMAFVMFGKNPIKELQQKELARRAKYGADPLTQETNIYIEQKKYQNGQIGKVPSLNVAPPDGTIPDAGDSVMVKTTPDGVAIIPPADSGVPPVSLQLPVAPQESYYPPVIGGADLNKAKIIQDNTLADGLKLRSGQKISFEGMNVYAVDKDGRKIPLPDGEYNLYDGSNITVHGGRSILNSISN